MDQETFANILEKHKKWVHKEPGGKRGNLSIHSLDSLDLSNLDLSRMQFFGTTFKSCKLSGSTFTKVPSPRVNFLDCNLREADFSASQLQHVYFRNCDLGKADFSASQLHFAHFDRSVAEETMFEIANFQGAIFGESNFGGANFQEALLREGSFYKCNMSSANLRQVNLSNSSFDQIDFTLTDMQDAILRYVQYKGDVCFSDKQMSQIIR